MPFDQHLFVPCIAPRALLVEGFSTRQWFDTKGEFLSLKAASPVWKFLGKSGLPEVDFPAEFDTSAIGKNLGYIRRSQGHGISAYDWKWMMDFADGVLGLGDPGKSEDDTLRNISSNSNVNSYFRYREIWRLGGISWSSSLEL